MTMIDYHAPYDRSCRDYLQSKISVDGKTFFPEKTGFLQRGSPKLTNGNENVRSLEMEQACHGNSLLGVSMWPFILDETSAGP